MARPQIVSAKAGSRKAAALHASDVIISGAATPRHQQCLMQPRGNGALSGVGGRIVDGGTTQSLAPGRGNCLEAAR